MKSGLDVMLAQIESDANTIKARRLEAAHDEGAKKYHELLAHATRRQDKSREIYNERVKQRYHNQLSAIDKSLSQEMDDVRQMGVDKVIEIARARMQNLDQQALEIILHQALTTHVNGIKPRIICNAHNHQGFVNAVGHTYQIVVDGSLSSGFILAFPDYDIDYRFETVFEHHKDALRRIALNALFDKETRTWII